MSSKRPKIVVLCVDLASVRAINAALCKTCDLVWAREAKGVLRLSGDDIAPAAVIIDNSVPQLNAIELLQNVHSSRKDVRRILVSDYCDLGLIVQGLHTGAVQSIVYKPIHAAELTAAVGVQNLAVMPATNAPNIVAQAG